MICLFWGVGYYLTFILYLIIIINFNLDCAFLLPALVKASSPPGSEPFVDPFRSCPPGVSWDVHSNGPVSRMIRHTTHIDNGKVSHQCGSWNESSSCPFRRMRDHNLRTGKLTLYARNASRDAVAVVAAVYKMHCNLQMCIYKACPLGEYPYDCLGDLSSWRTCRNLGADRGTDGESPITKVNQKRREKD